MVGVADGRVAVGDGHGQPTLEVLRREARALFRAIQIDGRQVVDGQHFDRHRVRLGAKGCRATVDGDIDTRLAVFAAGALVPGAKGEAGPTTVARRGHKANARHLVEQHGRGVGDGRERQPGRPSRQRILPRAIAGGSLDDGHALQRVVIDIGDAILALSLGALDDTLDGVAAGVDVVFVDGRQVHVAAVVEHRRVVHGVDQHGTDARQARQGVIADSDLY